MIWILIRHSYFQIDLQKSFLMSSSDEESHSGYGSDSDSVSDTSGHSSRSSDLSDNESESGGESGDNGNGGCDSEDLSLDRYAGRCDDVKPTVSLSDNVVKLAHEMITKGQFRDKKDWARIVRKYLTLPTPQYEMLSKDIKLEDVFDKFKGDPRYKNLFKYHNEARDALKSLRIAQRPVLCVIQRVNKELNFVRKAGEKSGMTYPAEAPPRSGNFVPRDNRKVPDKLKYESTEQMFPTPDLTTFAAKFQLGDDAITGLERILDNFRSDIGNKYLSLYNNVSAAFNDIDDYLIFHTDLYSHCDAAFRDLLRDRMASIFKAPVKTEILTRSSAKKLKVKPDGLYGGENGFRNNLRNATKKETYLKKAVNYKKPDNRYKRREYSRDRDYGSYRNRSSRPYSRRSRSRSYDRRDDRDDDKKYGSGSKDGGNKGYYGKGKFNKFRGKNKKSGSDKKE